MNLNIFQELFAPLTPETLGSAIDALLAVQSVQLQLNKIPNAGAKNGQLIRKNTSAVLILILTCEMRSARSTQVASEALQASHD